jgi:ATP-dependent protease Clp ATPase subunit
MYELPGRSDVGSVTIDIDTVIKKTAPKLIPREPKAKRPRREAS